MTLLAVASSILFFAAFLPLQGFARPSAPSCGYQSCPKPQPDAINIHLVPHTHDDVGWLKTVDQYYYGSLNNIQDAGVQYILDSVTQELLHDARKRFIYVETAYFWKWWQEQTDTVRHQVKKLVNRGQLEFIGGAWSMHDEATTHYHSIIDQFSWGLRRLNVAFGECGRPRVGWQIDPFGHSRESASIMARIGFDGLFLGRIDWEDKTNRLDNQTAEMIWFTSQNDGSDASKLFTSVMFNTYSAPKGFCFDINCHDEPIIDNKGSPMYNAPQRVSDFLHLMENYAKGYRTNNIIVTMGDDFMYMDAHMYYKNMDKLIYHINEAQKSGSKFHAFYSTPSCYMKAVHDSGVVLPTKSDDFMPYSSDPMAFWTGYFTSRPTIKYFERKGNNFLQVCKQLFSLAQLGPADKGDLTVMREAMGIMQHHDAITGTEKQHVARDYARILTDGFRECSTVADAAFNKLMPKDTAAPVVAFSCMLHNISSCGFTETEENFVVTVYNPLSRAVDRLVKLPIASETLSYTVLCPKGVETKSQVVPLPEEVLNIPGRNSSSTAELVFVAKHLPPLGYKSFYISKNQNNIKQDYDELKLNGETTTLGFDKGASVTIDGNGKVVKIGVNNEEIPLEQAFYYYNGAVGNNEVFANRSSGAYIFRPNGSEVLIDEAHEFKIIDGPVVKEVRAKYSDWVSQVIRIYAGAQHVEFEWLVGPIPINNGIGKEVINRFKTSAIHNNGEFATDSNGREFLKRRLNYRPTWQVNLAEKVPGNYYPLTTAISIKDSQKRLTVITDRAQGGSSLNDGELELMVHRRLTHDDAFGVGEALNETAYGVGLVARGSHYVTTGNMAQVRTLIQEKVLDSWVFLNPTNGMSFEDWSKNNNMEFSGLAAGLPENVQILTLEPWLGNTFLFRLEHIMESHDDPKWSKPATVHIQKLFANWKITSIEETMLGANQKVSDVKRLVWKHEENFLNYGLTSEPYVKPVPVITLQPMQIRTFIIQVQNK